MAKKDEGSWWYPALGVGFLIFLGCMLSLYLETEDGVGAARC